MSNDKATPRPWRVVEGNLIFGADYSEVGDTCVSADGYDTQMANAALIVKAVNLHDRLVEALRDVIEQTGAEPCWYDHHGYCQEHNLAEKEDCWFFKAQALISEAEK
jgi:hypothetical protein